MYNCGQLGCPDFSCTSTFDSLLENKTLKYNNINTNQNYPNCASKHHLICRDQLDYKVKTTYLLTAGRFKITSKNFSRITSKAASLIAGLATMSPVFLYPFAAILFFFRNAAENPEAQTYNGVHKLELSSFIYIRM